VILKLEAISHPFQAVAINDGRSHICVLFFRDLFFLIFASQLSFRKTRAIDDIYKMANEEMGENLK